MLTTIISVITWVCVIVYLLIAHHYFMKNVYPSKDVVKHIKFITINAMIIFMLISFSNYINNYISSPKLHINQNFYENAEQKEIKDVILKPLLNVNDRQERTDKLLDFREQFEEILNN